MPLYLGAFYCFLRSLGGSARWGFACGATLGLSNAVLTIIDNDYLPGRLSFSAATYATNKNAGAATITVTRTGGSLNLVSVQAVTTNLSAVAGADYVAVTNTLSWNSGDSSPRTFTVPIIPNGVPGLDKTVLLQLKNFSDQRTAGVRTNAVLTIVRSSRSLRRPRVHIVPTIFSSDDDRR